MNAYVCDRREKTISWKQLDFSTSQMFMSPKGSVIWKLDVNIAYELRNNGKQFFPANSCALFSLQRLHNNCSNKVELARKMPFLVPLLTSVKLCVFISHNGALFFPNIATPLMRGRRKEGRGGQSQNLCSPIPSQCNKASRTNCL